jgi:hypothetical protein
MTERELELLNMLGEVWNTFLSLPQEHPDDTTQFRQNLHILQHQVMARPTRRQLNARY